MDIIKGQEIDRTRLICEKQNGRIIKGLELSDGTQKWFDILDFGDFHCGLASVDWGGAFGYINRNGELLIETEYIIGEDFSEERALASNGSSTVLLNTKGTIIKKWDEAFITNPFSNGIARVSQMSNDGESSFVGCIDREGNEILPPLIESVIDHPLDLYDPDDNFSCGLLRIKYQGKYGFIDTDMHVVIPAMYDWASRFENNLAAVKLDDRFGYIDKSGNMIIPLIGEDATRFHRGQAFLKYNDRWTEINSSGIFINTLDYEKIGNIINGYYPVSVHNRYGLINHSLHEVIAPQYDRILNYSEGLFWFVQNGKTGVRDADGNYLLSELLHGSEYYSAIN